VLLVSSLTSPAGHRQGRMVSGRSPGIGSPAAAPTAGTAGRALFAELTTSNKDNGRGG